MYTYNTNRRQNPSKARKDAEPEHQEGKKQIKEGRHKTAVPSGSNAVLCILPILSVLFFRVDEHAQGSPFREFLV